MVKQIKEYNPTRRVMGFWLVRAIKTLEKIREENPESTAGYRAANTLRTIPTSDQVGDMQLGNW